MGTFVTEEILSEGGITGTTVSGGTFYGDGSGLLNVPSSFSGGSVTGITATTISATTYQNLPNLSTTTPLQGGGGLSSGLNLSITQSSTSTDGYLSSTDWNTFNNKVSTSRTITTTSPLSGGGDLSTNRTLSITQSTTSTDGYLSSTDWNTFNNKVSTTRTISTTSPLSGGGDLSANRTLSIQDAAADGTTKGAASFTANDFDSSSGVISIDYTNGQAASSSNKGFLTNTDWTTFNNKSRIQYNFSVAPQVLAANTVTYITNSNITTANIQAGTIVTWDVSVSKTAAGTAAPVWTVRFGTNSSTADSTLLTFTANAQTAAIDTGIITIICVFRTVGSGVSAVLTGHYRLTHQLATTGLSNGSGGVFATSAGFNSTTANSFLGLTVNTGAAAVWTVNQVSVKIENIL